MSNSRTLVLIAACASAAALAPAGSARAEIVFNGDFELGTDPDSYAPGFVPGVKAGDGHIDGWEIDFGDVDYIGSYWTAASGGRSLDLNGNNLTSPGAISQSVFLEPGQWYRLSFEYSGNPAGGDSYKTMRVTLGASLSIDLAYDTAAEGTTLADMQWKTLAVEFQADAEKNLLRFASTMRFAFGAAIDNVQIVAVPGPGAGAALVIGAGVCAVRRRRRN